MEYNVYLRASARRYATELPQRTVGAEFVQLVRDQYGYVSLNDIRCTINSRFDYNHRLPLSEEQVEEAGCFTTACQVLVENWSAGWLNEAVDIIVGSDQSNTSFWPVYWLNPQKAYDIWKAHGFEYSSIPWRQF